MTQPLIGWLWRGYLRRHWPLVAVSLVLMALEGGMLGLLSYLVQPMFDQVFVAADRSAVAWVALGVSGVFAVRALAGFGHRVLMAIVGRRVSAALQRDLVGHLLTLDLSFFHVTAPGTLIERVRGDTLSVSTVWAVVFGAAGRDMVALASLLYVAVSVDWLWAVIAVAGAPLLLWPITVLQRLVRRTTLRAREAAAVIATRLDESFHGISTIKLMGIETHDRQRFGQALGGFVRAEIRAEAAQAGIPALIDIVAAIGFAGVLAYGGLQIIDGEKSVGEFMSFFTAMALVFEPLRRLGNVSGAWQVARASLQRIRSVFDERPTVLPPPAPAAMPAGDIVFDDVSFAYDDAPVLNGLGFTARAGQTTALVGPSGAGKSTVFALLARLVDPQNGGVSIGGTDTRDLSLADLRGAISVVSQEASLFDESLADNILLGRADVDAQRLADVCAAAHVSDFLPALPAGLDSPAGPRGSNLSGGQRQRVAIARALLRNTPILLLDEATSALDAQSEVAVQSALDGLAQGRTTLVIAHRLSTVRNADQIIVMDKGRVVEAGRHDELLANDGLYAGLYRLQFAGAA